MFIGYVGGAKVDYGLVVEVLGVFGVQGEPEMVVVVERVDVVCEIGEGKRNLDAAQGS